MIQHVFVCIVRHSGQGNGIAFLRGVHVRGDGAALVLYNGDGIIYFGFRGDKAIIAHAVRPAGFRVRLAVRTEIHGVGAGLFNRIVLVLLRGEEHLRIGMLDHLVVCTLLQLDGELVLDRVLTFLKVLILIAVRIGHEHVLGHELHRLVRDLGQIEPRIQHPAILLIRGLRSGCGHRLAFLLQGDLDADVAIHNGKVTLGRQIALGRGDIMVVAGGELQAALIFRPLGVGIVAVVPMVVNIYLGLSLGGRDPDRDLMGPDPFRGFAARFDELDAMADLLRRPGKGRCGEGEQHEQCHHQRQKSLRAHENLLQVV